MRYFNDVAITSEFASIILNIDSPIIGNPSVKVMAVSAPHIAKVDIPKYIIESE